MIISGQTNIKSPGSFSSLIRSGDNKKDELASLTINNGKFSGGLNTVKNGDFSTLVIDDGVFNNTAQAVVLNWHEAEIRGGEFKPADRAMDAVVTGIWKEADYNTNGNTLIKGGTFEGPVSLLKDGVYEPSQATAGHMTIEGGTFLTDVTEYLAEGYTVIQEGATYKVVKE